MKALMMIIHVEGAFAILSEFAVGYAASSACASSVPVLDAGAADGDDDDDDKADGFKDGDGDGGDGATIKPMVSNMVMATVVMMVTTMMVTTMMVTTMMVTTMVMVVVLVMVNAYHQESMFADDRPTSTHQNR